MFRTLIWNPTWAVSHGAVWALGRIAGPPQTPNEFSGRPAQYNSPFLGFSQRLARDLFGSWWKDGSLLRLLLQFQFFRSIHKSNLNGDLNQPSRTIWKFMDRIFKSARESGSLNLSNRSLRSKSLAPPSDSDPSDLDPIRSQQLSTSRFDKWPI